MTKLITYKMIWLKFKEIICEKLKNIRNYQENVNKNVPFIILCKSNFKLMWSFMRGKCKSYMKNLKRSKYQIKIMLLM